MALQVLRVLGKTSRSKVEIAHAMGKAKPNRYLDELMKRLLESGLTEYTLPEKPNSRLQRYRLTELGQERISHMETAPCVSNLASDELNT